MAGPCAHMGEAERLEQLSNIALVEVDAEPLSDDALEVHPSPGHDPVFSRSGPASTMVANSANCSADSRGSGHVRPIVDEAPRTRCVKAMAPVTQRLPVHAADPRRRPPVHPVPRQKPPALIDVLRP